MGMGFWQSKWKLIAGTGLLIASVGLPLVSRAQSPGDVIRIGNSPYDWNQFNSYWNQLINLGGATRAPSGAAAGVPSGAPAPSATDPQVLEKTLVRNLRISNMRFVPILKLNGSSQLTGSITNGNNKSVTVASINLEIYDAGGRLVQTSAVVPEPATIPAGGTVTFQKRLDTIPARGGYRAQLSKTPIVLQGGV
ncbi:MAG: FxLYD domain-containing protein [Thermosynechococcaceae cyanobacterium]